MKNPQIHYVIWDGTSCYVGGDFEASEMDNDTEVLASYYDFEVAEEHADSVNEMAYPPYGDPNRC